MDTYPSSWQPHPHQPDELRGFSFITQWGVSYQCDLTFHELFTWPAYSIDLFYLNEGGPYPREIRLLFTVGSALAVMMQNDPKTVFFYLTDHSDGREQIRVRSFLRAFKQANPKDLKIYSLAVNDGDKAQFVGCLWHIQHPDSDRIEDVVDQEIKNFLAQK